MERFIRILATAIVALFPAFSSMGGGKEIEEIARLRELADSLHSVGRTDSALTVGEQAIRLAEKAGDATQIVGTHSAQGVFLRSSGRIDEAVKSYGKALDIVTSGQFRDHTDNEAVEEIATLYINMATLDLDMAHKEAALSHAATSASWTARSTDPQFRSMAYGVAGSVMTACGDLGKAAAYQELAYGDALKSGDKESAFRAAAYTLLVKARIGDKAGADKWRGTCRKLLPEVPSTMARLVYYQAECSIALSEHRDRDAIGWFKEILSLEGIENLPFIQYDCYNNMHEAYAALGDYRNAYSTLLKGNEVRDSLYAREKAESLRDLTVKYQTKETELALSRSEAQRATTLMWLLGALALLLLLSVVFIFYAGRQRRRRMEKEMEFGRLRADVGRRLAEEYVDGLENERQRMSRELHDGVCNDLLAIEMNMEKPDGDRSETIRLLKLCRDSVRRISHELMPPEFAYADLDEVVRYHVDKQNASGTTCITYRSEGEGWERVSDHVALEIYRIAQEALGNALRHSGADRIEVFLSRTDSGITLIVHDNGTGTGANSGSGAGRGSMAKRASMAGGTVRTDSIPGEGTTVTLHIPATE